MLIPNKGQRKNCLLFFCGTWRLPTFTLHHKNYLMRKLFFIAAVSVLFSYCSSSPGTGTPKGVVNAFMEASKKGDIESLKKYITSQDAALLSLGESFMKNLDSSQADGMKEKMAEDFKKKTEGVKIDIGNEKINGDEATVDVTMTKEGKPETLPFALKKEDGKWKISLMSTGMRASGMSQAEMDKEIKNVQDGMKDMAGMKDSLAKAIEQLKGINKDSLAKIMNQSTEQLKKLQEAAEKAGKQ